MEANPPVVGLQNQPPATAGTMLTSSPSARAVAWLSRNRMSSLFTYTFRKRRSLPLSSVSLARMPGKRPSRAWSSPSTLVASSSTLD